MTREEAAAVAAEVLGLALQRIVREGWTPSDATEVMRRRGLISERPTFDEAADAHEMVRAEVGAAADRLSAFAMCGAAAAGKPCCLARPA